MSFTLSPGEGVQVEYPFERDRGLGRGAASSSKIPGSDSSWGSARTVDNWLGVEGEIASNHNGGKPIIRAIAGALNCEPGGISPFVLNHRSHLV